MKQKFFHKNSTHFFRFRARILMAAILFVVILGLSGSNILAPERAHAYVFPTVESPFSPPQEKLQKIEKPAIYFIKKAVLAFVQKMVLKQIFQKNTYIKNWTDYLANKPYDSAIKALDEFLGVDLGQGIDGSIIEEIILGQLKPVKEKLKDRVPYNLDQFVQDPEDWNILKDGWTAFHASLQDNNNPYGVYLTALSLAQESAAQTQLENVTAAIAGGGFDVRDKDGNVKTPGQVVLGTVNATLKAQYDLDTNSDVFTSVIGPVITQLMNKLLDEGLGRVGL